MAISDKLTYLNGTKQKLKQAINNLGGDITSQTTFRNYATELDTLYSNLPKVEGEGSSITLSPTLKGKLDYENNIVGYGDTSQNGTPTPDTPIDIEVVTGTQEVKVENKNLLVGIEVGDINAQSGVENSLSGSIKSTNYIRYFTDKTYYAIVNGVISTTIGLNLRFYNKNKEYIGYGVLIGSGSNFTITKGNQVTTTDLTPVYFRFRQTLSAGPITSLDDQVMITTINDLTYVEHQEQTQIVSLGDIELCKIGNYQDYLYKTSGKNVIDWANINYSNLNGASSTRTGNEYNVVAGDTQWGHVRFTQADLNLKPNTNYVFRARIKSTTNTNGARIRVISSMNVGGEDMYSNATTTGNVAVLSFTTPSTIPSDGAICLYPYAPNTNATFSELMIYEGTDTALPYEPYGSGKWYKKENIYKIANKTNWVVNSIRSNNRAVCVLTSNSGLPAVDNFSGINCLATHFVAISQPDIVSTTSINVVAINNTNMYVKFADTINTKELAQAQLNSMTSLAIYYAIATPNDIEITNTTLIEQLDNIYNAMSYNGTTNIEVVGDLPMIMKVRALKGESN